MQDVLIVGGGVIGLSLAWDLAKHGRSVHVIDRGEPGREASWAGAGILPAARWHDWQHPLDQLRGLSNRLHGRWAAELTATSGIDTGYRRCGGLHLARTAGEAAALAAWSAMMADEGVEVKRLPATSIADIEPGLSRNSASAAFHVPDEAQLRNPRHLQSLVLACTKLGVNITPNLAIHDVRTDSRGISELATSSGPLRAHQYCFTAGAWTGTLLHRLGIATGVLPVRGQMVLLRSHQPPISHIINEGSRYLVPRDDGYLLAGSTEEEVGFDKSTTEEALSELTEFARGLVPALRDASIEKTWSGLRPGSFDGLPYLGPLPGINNAFVAAGHFRNGLFLSPATAVVVSQLMRCEQPQIDLAPFRVGR